MKQLKMINNKASFLLITPEGISLMAVLGFFLSKLLSNDDQPQ